MRRRIPIPAYIGVLLVICAQCSAAGQTAGKNQRVFKKQLPQEQITKTGSGTYYLTLPGDYDKHQKRWPLILFLHGGGGHIEGAGAIAPHRIAGALEDFPFIVVTPLCPRKDGWSSDFQKGVLNTLLDDVIANYRIDESRIYLTGVSMGGYGTWSLALEYPDRFAAIAPICGGGRTSEAARIKHLPIRVFHCIKDYKVPISRSEAMVKALAQCGADVQLTKYPLGGFEGNPHDAWSRTYSNPEFYEWLLGNRRSEDGQIVKNDLILDENINKEAWVGALVKFRRGLFAKFRRHEGFTDIKGDDPARGLSFSLPIRNHFPHEMQVSVEWEQTEGSPWVIASDRSKTIIPAGAERTFRFTASIKGQGRVFPRPVCKVNYTAGEARGQIRIDLPMDVDSYLKKHRPKLIARRAMAPPTIDGKLDDPVWGGRADVIDFQSSKLDRTSPVRTEGWVAYDDKHYYVAMRCYEPFMDKLKLASNKRDGPLWNADSIEVLLDTARDRKNIQHYFRSRKIDTFYQFIINPAGAFYDSRVPDKSFNTGTTVATSKDKTGWTVELAIPWADLNVDPPGKDTQMGFLLSRTRYPKDGKDHPQADALNLQYPPLNGWNHRKEHYGDLIFGP